MTQYWVWPVDADNWNIVTEKSVWATANKYAPEKLKKGDQIVFYLRGQGGFCGVGEVVSDWYKNKELFWANETQGSPKIYPYECKLKIIQKGDASYSELVPKLSFVSNKAYTGQYLRATHGGPANFGKPIPPNDYKTIIEALKQPVPSSEPTELQTEPEEHEDIVSRIVELGTFMGFEASDSTEDTKVSTGAILDAIWKVNVANIAEVSYAFELQHKGSVDSLVRNLQRAARNPSVRGLVIVAFSQSELERIRKEAWDFIEDEKGRVSLITVEELNKAYEHFKANEEFKNKLGLKI